MKIKVCGMREPENIRQLLQLPVDYVGLIFFPKSKRNINRLLPEIDFGGKKKVGVFVDPSLDFVLQKKQEFDLQMIQLHGKESPEYCHQIKKETGLKVIKAFSIGDQFGWRSPACGI